MKPQQSPLPLNGSDSSIDGPSPTPSIGNKAITAASWLSATQLVARTLTLVRLMVLARLLSPTEIGLFGAAVLVLTTLETFSQIGLDSALIQKSRNVETFLNTAWTSTLVRGLVLGVLLYSMAPHVAQFLDQDNLTEPLQALALVPILTGLSNNSAIALLNRDLQFQKLAFLQISIAVVELTVTVVFALFHPSVWALVAGRLASMGCNTGISYALTDYRPRLEFNRAKFLELHSFGIWVFVAGIVGFLLVSGGDWVIATILPVATLGVYQVASNFSNMPTTQLAQVVTKVTFPAFSRLQEEKGRLQSAFLRSFLVISLIVMFVTSLVISLSNDFILLFLGARWKEAGPIMQFLAVWGACRGLGASNSTLFQAVGKPSVAVIFQGVMLILFAALVYPMTVAYGALGVAMLLAGVGVVGQFLRYPLLSRTLDIPISSLYWRTFIPITAATASITISHLCRQLLAEAPVWMRFGVCSVAVIGCYILVLYLWEWIGKQQTISPLVHLVQSKLKSKGTK